MNRVNTTLKVIKMLFNSWKKSVAIYLGIAIIVYSYMVFSQQASLGFEERTHVGITFANAIFIFILAIASFAEDFRLAVSMNVSRRIFFSSKTLTLAALSIILTIVDLAVGNLLAHLTKVPFIPIISRTLMTIIEHESYPFLNLFIVPALAVAFLFLTATAGWLIRLLYYRTNKLQKILLSISPVVLLYLYSVLYKITQDILNFIDIAVTDDINALIVILFFFGLITAIFNLASCYLLIRRAPAK